MNARSSRQELAKFATREDRAVSQQHQHLFRQGGWLGVPKFCYARVVLVDAVPSDQQIQQQQPRPEPLGGLEQLLAVRLAVQPERGGCDDMDLDLLQAQATVPAEVVRPRGAE